jgi:outer membrane protein assembly factor BamB
MRDKHTRLLLILLAFLAVIIVVLIFGLNLLGTLSGRRDTAETTSPTEESANPASVVVAGTGNDLYYVFDATGEQKIDFTSTNEEIQLPPGTYTVSLQGIRQTVEAAAGQKVVLESGTLVLTGIGQDLYSVYDATGKEKLNFKTINGEIELFPGTYIVSLNGVRQTVKVQAGSKEIVEAGVLEVLGEENDLFYLYDATGKKKLDFRSVNGKIELLPRQYTVVVKDNKFTAQVEANKTVTIGP